MKQNAFINITYSVIAFFMNLLRYTLFTVCKWHPVIISTSGSSINQCNNDRSALHCGIQKLTQCDTAGLILTIRAKNTYNTIQVVLHPTLKMPLNPVFISQRHLLATHTVTLNVGHIHSLAVSVRAVTTLLSAYSSNNNISHCASVQSQPTVPCSMCVCVCVKLCSRQGLEMLLYISIILPSTPPVQCKCER